jgi:hypothetical protein
MLQKLSVGMYTFRLVVAAETETERIPTYSHVLLSLQKEAAQLLISNLIRETVGIVAENQKATD